MKGRVLVLVLCILILQIIYSVTSTVSKNEDKDNIKHDKDISDRRPLRVGDTFTAKEMLPITIKLIEKVENPGQGKGIVSSAKSPEALADKLFEAFFLTPRRIVILKEYDLSGLDALQALALSGEVVDDGSLVKVVTEPTKLTLNSRGQYVVVGNELKRCKYRLVTKKSNEENISRSKKSRRVIELAKKLGKKRRLVVNTNSKHSRKNNRYLKTVNTKRTANMLKTKHSNKTTESRDDVKKTNKQSKVKNQQQKKSSCRWRYECQDPTDLDTCALQTQCIRNGTTVTEVDDIPVKHNPDEHSNAIRLFRKMLGISVIDEEVEKILEIRILYLKPSNFGSARIESLSEYFNNIIVSKYSGTTTPIAITENSFNEDVVQSDAQQTDDGNIIKSSNEDEIITNVNEKEQATARRILGMPTIPTAKTKSFKD